MMFVIPSIIILIINHFEIKKHKYRFLLFIPLCLVDVFIYAIYIYIIGIFIEIGDEYMALPFISLFICAFLSAISLLTTPNDQS